jgi:hypothetical protein
MSPTDLQEAIPTLLTERPHLANRKQVGNIDQGHVSDASATLSLGGVLRSGTQLGSKMSDYNTAWDSLAEAIGAAKGVSSGSITDTIHMTIDQRLKVAEIAALLSISQELSALNPKNESYKDGEGNERNGWGLRTHDTKRDKKVDNRMVAFGD